MSRIAAKVSTRSSGVSPIPISKPVVKGIPNLPASSIVLRRLYGGLSGALSCAAPAFSRSVLVRSEEHTSELQSLTNLVCRLLLEKKKNLTSQLLDRILCVDAIVHRVHGAPDRRRARLEPRLTAQSHVIVARPIIDHPLAPPLLAA